MKRVSEILLGLLLCSALSACMTQGSLSNFVATNGINRPNNSHVSWQPQSSKGSLGLTTVPEIIDIQLLSNEIATLIDQPLSIIPSIGQEPAQLTFKSMGESGLFMAEWTGGFNKNRRAAFENDKICEIEADKTGVMKTCYSVFRSEDGGLKFIFSALNADTGILNKYSFLTEPLEYQIN